MDNELADLHTPSLASSSAPSLDSSLERMHILSSPEPDAEDHDTGDDPPEFDFTETSLQLTPVLRQICPATPTREPNYENIPSLSSIPSLPSEAPLSTPESATRKTRAQRHITPVLAKRRKKVPKFVLTYKWKKSVTFRHQATIEENQDHNIMNASFLPTADSLEYFNLFFSSDIVTDITVQSNLYSVQKTGKSIQVTEDEMRDFIAIHILMGIVSMPSYLDYWSSRFRYAPIADLMSLKRYQQIRRFLHFADNSLEDTDRYYKVRPIAEKIRKNCLLQENENKFSIDEMMIAYKGRKAGNRKQYMKDKPNKWGFKNYVRAGVSGMIYDFILYGGEDTFRFHKFTEQEISIGFGAQIVIALCQSIQRKPATIFCDNFFSSPELFYILKENYGVFGLGTIRNNRTRGAGSILPSKKAMKKKKRGAYSQVVCDKTKLALVRWNDNKPVTLISSFVGCTPVHKIKRYCKVEKRKLDVDCPQIVREYNKHMGGVDLGDMLVSLYKIPFKSRRWYIGIFCQLLDISINNSWILYKKNTNDRKKMSLKIFRQDLYLNLTKKNRSVRSHSIVENSTIKNPKLPRPISPIRFDNICHFPNTKEDMGRCKYCLKNTTVYCMKCNIRLCFVTGKKSRNCFLNFHTK